MKELQTTGGRDVPHDRNFRILQPLAESVILQAMEDLWSRRYREESVEFFQGSGFGLYAVIAGMNPYEKGALLSFMRSALPGQQLSETQPSSNNPDSYKTDHAAGKI